MGQAIRKFEVIEGGSSIPAIWAIDEPIGEPLANLEKWLSITAVADLAEVSERAVQKNLAKGRWRGVDLIIRQIEIGRGGAGGTSSQVHVDSLPSDLRAVWYAQHGIALHEAVDAATGETRLIPEDAGRNDPKWDERCAGRPGRYIRDRKHSVQAVVMASSMPRIRWIATAIPLTKRRSGAPPMRSCVKAG